MSNTIHSVPALIFIIGFLPGCATLHDREWMRVRADYLTQCEQWKEGLRPVDLRSPAEETQMVQDIVRDRCLRDRAVCLPPPKPRALIEFEVMWGEPETSCR